MKHYTVTEGTSCLRRIANRSVFFVLCAALISQATLSPFAASPASAATTTEEITTTITSELADARGRAEERRSARIAARNSDASEAPAPAPASAITEEVTTEIAPEVTTLTPAPTNTLEEAPVTAAAAPIIEQAVVAPAALAAVVAGNLVANGDFELGTTNNPTAWAQGEWGALTTTYAFPVAGVTGNAAKVTVSGYQDGDAKWFHNEVPVTAGTTYVYKDKYKATIASSIVIQYRNASNVMSYVWLKDAPVASAWNDTEVSFLVPTGIVAVSVFHLIAGNGSITLDNVSIVPSAPATPGKPMITVTFDDGWTSQYTNAIPLLTKYSIKGTFYIITDTLVPGKYTGYMTRAQVKAVAAKGHEIGSHTVTHANLPTLNATQLKNQLVNSKKTLETLLAKKINSIAYPYGEYNASVITAAKNAGYTNARTVDEALNDKLVDKHKIRSYSPTGSTPLSELTAAIDAAKRDGQWMVVAFHEINNTGNEYANTPAYLEQFLQYAKASGVDIVTVNEGLAQLANQ